MESFSLVLPAITPTSLRGPPPSLFHGVISPPPHFVFSHPINPHLFHQVAVLIAIIQKEEEAEQKKSEASSGDI